MDSDIYFAISIILFTFNMGFLLRPLYLIYFSDKNLLQFIYQIFKFLFGIVKGFFAYLFLSKIYYDRNTELEFNDISNKQISWLGGGNFWIGLIVYFGLISMTIISFIFSKL